MVQEEFRDNILRTAAASSITTIQDENSIIEEAAAVDESTVIDEEKPDDNTVGEDTVIADDGIFTDFSEVALGVYTNGSNEDFRVYEIRCIDNDYYIVCQINLILD